MFNREPSPVCASTFGWPISMATRVTSVLRTAVLTLVAGLAIVPAVHAQETWTVLPSFSKTQDTADKPQSKAWFHGHTWWAVLATDAAVPGGTWLLRLEPDNTWAFVRHLSDNTGSRADVKIVGDVAHVLLNNSGPELMSLQYNAAINNYEPWSERTTSTPVYVGETATIDIDSTGRMWLATETVSDIEMYYSDYPYSSFSGPISIATGINSDDIAAVTALPNNTIGVFWSNQNTTLFGFRAHEDGADPSVWLDDEAPGADAAVDDGIGLAEDHINTAVASDGTLYVAVKTGYSLLSLPTIGLYVRHPDSSGPGGTWDPIYFVDTVGTRPIVVLNEDTQTIRVFYTSTSGSLYFRESPASSIAFGPIYELLPGTSFNNVTSTKDRWTGRLLVLTGDDLGITGVVIAPEGGLVGHWKMDEGGAQLNDVSGYGNHADVVGTPALLPGVEGLALDLDGSDYAAVSDQQALDVTSGLTISAWIQPGAQTDQDVVSRSVTGSVDGYTLGLSSASATTAPGTVFLRLNEATSGDVFQLNSISQYPSSGQAWMHVAATYDGTTMRMFVNGVEEASIPGPVAIGASAVDLGIGAQGDGAHRFHGAVDDVRIYNRALDPSEIALFAASAPPEADLAITKDDFEDSVYVGQELTYTIEATNLGPSDAFGAVVTDIVPPQLTDVSWTCTATAGVCSASGVGSISDVVNLPVGGSLTYTVHAKIALTASGFIHNTATIRASAVSDLVAGNNSATDTDVIPIILEAHFDSDEEGFGYADDLFRGTSEPSYASGAYAAGGGFSGGALQVAVGGVNSQDIFGMSGGWQRTFTLTSPTPASLSFQTKLTETPEYEADEFSQVLVSIDGVLVGVTPEDYIAQVVGGGPTTTGWVFAQVNLGVLGVGTHTLAIGGYNNQKTYHDESAEVLIDDVLVTAGLAPVPPSITTNPSDVIVTAPDPSTFTVVAAGDAPLSYQWRRNGVDIPGATASTYVLDPTPTAYNGSLFDVVVTSPFGTATSSAATLTVHWSSGGSTILMDANFDTGTNDFAYADDVFRGTSEPSYASGAHLAAGGFTGGALQVVVGGVNSSDIFNMSGGWQRSFSMAAPAPLTLSFRTQLTETPDYETDEFSQALVSLDGVLFGVSPNDYIAQVVGGGTTTTGWLLVEIDLGTVSAGTHVLSIGAYNNGKTYYNESAEVLIDDVLLTAGESGPVAPGITTPPADVTVVEPAAAGFSVVASGDVPLTYQWRRNGVDIPGANGTSYVLDPTSVADSGDTFDVVVTNAVGTATSAAATLTVTPAPVPPSITTQPESVTVTEPAPAAFSVLATGDAPLSYQWRRNGVDIPGATGASYLLDPTAVADSGASFDVVVSNGAGTATSAPAILVVDPIPVPPAIVTPPAGLTVTAPDPAGFTVVADGDAPLSYQWRRNGVDIPGATGVSYVLDPTTVGDSGASFDVVVTNGAGTATSAAALLTVNPTPVPPTITVQPVDVTVTEPAPASFTVVADGDAPLSYQWRRNGVDLPGATSPTFTLNPTFVSDSGQFDVVVTNPVGSITSAAATLTVNAGGGGGATVLIEAHFGTNADGFTYADDVFRGTSEPNYASGTYMTTGGVTSGALQVGVGGINNYTILGMSGGWQRSFSLAGSSPVALSFQYQLTETSEYESDEHSQMLVSLDGVLYGIPPNDYVDQVVGGGPTSTGWQEAALNLGTLSAGTHVLTLGVYNNQKTRGNESAAVLIDDVLVTVGAVPVPPAFTTPPAPVVVTEGAAATFTAAATGDAPLGYQWRRNGAAIPGAIGPSYTLDPTSLADSGAQFDVVVTNPLGSVTSDPVDLTVLGGGTTTALIDQHFNAGTGEFVYADDVFRGTSQPLYASGSELTTGGFTGGAVQVNVGGKDSATILGMSGGWQQSFELAAPTHVILSFRYNLTEGPEYETDEFSQMLASVDGVLFGTAPNDYVAQVVGGGPTTTGWQFVQIDLGTLPAGTHVLSLGAYNNQKTYVNESADVVIDDVLLAY